MILKENFVLSNGVEIPKLGLGTWKIENDVVAQAICDAVEVGYRHFDTAPAYHNEKGIGDGIRACGIKREELFITTKLDARVKDYDSAITAIEASREKLGLEYIDLVLIHRPQPWAEIGSENRYFEGNKEAWRAMEYLYKEGKIRAIGLSVFEIVDLENILTSCTVKPMVHQLKVNTSYIPFELIEFSRKNGMLIEGYSPIAHGDALHNPKLIEIAEKYNVSVPQLCIRFDYQFGTLPLPKTANKEHMRSNAEIDFEISDADMDELLKLVENEK